MAASIQQSAQQLSLWQQEYRLMQADGSLRWVSGRAMPERMPDHSILWHGYIYVITTTKEYYLALERADDDLKLAQQRLELSSQQAQIGYWQVSLRSGTLWWSPMIYDLFGLDENSTTPNSELFKRIVHPDDLDLVERSEAQAIETGYHDVIHRIIRPDGEVRWVHELARMLPANDNPDLLMIGSMQDITERMRLQQVMANLLSNAIKYSPIDGVIQVDLAVQDGAHKTTTISVADHGPGVPPAFRERLWTQKPPSVTVSLSRFCQTLPAHTTMTMIKLNATTATATILVTCKLND